jgi:uncharacterized PurR-regulated membrane protein YhhQ (DUF165 family)
VLIVSKLGRSLYGYSASRRAIWTGFLASSVMIGMGLFARWLPPDPAFKNQGAFEAVFGVVPRIVAGSLIAYWAGVFANSLTVAKMKLLTNGKYLSTPTVGSTLIGQAIYSGYLSKVVYEVLAAPLTYLIVNRLKRSEGIDFFDRSTNFNPFKLCS